MENDLNPSEQHHPKRKLALVGGGAVAAVLIAGGIYIHVTYEAHDGSGRTVREIQAEMDILEKEIEVSSEKESSLFYDTGFSDEYFDAANEAAELQEQKNELESIAEDLTEEESSKDILRTGALWFFVAALLAAATGITVYLRL